MSSGRNMPKFRVFIMIIVSVVYTICMFPSDDIFSKVEFILFLAYVHVLIISFK